MTATTTTRLSAGTWAIDPVHSSVNFSVRHLMVNNVRGRFDEFSGSIVITEDGAASVSAEISGLGELRQRAARRAHQVTRIL